MSREPPSVRHPLWRTIGSRFQHVLRMQKATRMKRYQKRR